MARCAVLAIVLLGALSACSGLPTRERLTALADPAAAERRGAVELAVKTNWPAILTEIEAGGGATLTASMDAARIPVGDRSARILQLQGDLPLYRDNPGALSLSLVTYGSG